MSESELERSRRVNSRPNPYLERIKELETVLQSIANEKVELSYDKIKWQVEDHIRWAKEVLNEA